MSKEEVDKAVKRRTMNLRRTRFKRGTARHLHDIFVFLYEVWTAAVDQLNVELQLKIKMIGNSVNNFEG